MKMPSLGYMIAAVVIAGVITILLRALPFAILKPLRNSRFVKLLGRWMPAGLMLILAVVMLYSEIVARPGLWWAVLVAGAATTLTHIFAGRRALLSIFVGTAVYIALLYFF